MTDPPTPSAGLRRIFHAAGVPMLLVDPESGLIEDANDALCRFYGRAREELVGQALTVISRSSPERLRDALSTAAVSGHAFAVNHVTASRREVLVTVTAAPVELDGRRLLVEVLVERGPDADARSALALLYEATADVHRAIVRARSEAELWSEASRIVVQVGGFRLAWVAIVDEALRVARVAAAAGDLGYLDGRIDDLDALSRTPIAQALASGHTVVHGDIAADRPGPYADRAIEFGLRSGAAVPMREGDAPPFGALVVLEDSPAALAGERVALLERLAGDLGVARTLLRTTERLRASEERYRSMVEQASAGIMVFGHDGSVLEANAAACAMLGHSLQSLRSAGRDVVVHDLSLEEEAGIRDRLREGDLWVDRRFRRADGQVITVAFQGRLRGDGAIEAVVQDVTAERRAQAALRASEARYRDLVGVLQEGIIAYDAQGRVTEMNDAARRLHRSGPDGLIGSDATELAATFIREDGSPYPPDELPTQNVLRTGRPTERRIIGIPEAGGSVRWLSSNAVPTGLDGGGRPSGIVVSFVDVTDLREAVARATASESRVRQLVDEAFDGVIVLDAEGVVAYANPAAGRMLEMPPTALIGRHVEAFVAPHERDRVDADLARLAAGEAFVGERVLLRSDGAELAVEVTGSRLADGRLEILARDVTVRKRLEAERDRLAQAAEQSSDAIYITDSTGVIVYVNRAYERMNGYLREEVVGQTPSVHEASEQAVGLAAQIADALGTQGAWAGEVAHRAKDGTRFRVSSRVVALRDATGRVTGQVGVARDISVEREEDARLAQAARLEAVGQLAGGVAHDLNNVLTMIVGHAALLDPSTATPAEIAAGVQSITEAAGRAERMTTRLLAFGRRAFLQPRRSDLRDLLTGTQPILARALGPRVALAVSPGTTAVPVSLDPNLFEQALMALAVYERGAMPEGGTLRLGIERARADETLRGVEAAVLVLSDSGPGMAPETLDRLFEPFASVGGDESGLGLAMVHGFVEQSGGRVTVTSSPDSGTTFRIVLPLDVAPAATPKPPKAVQPARSGPATILVAEDEAVLRRVAHRTLTARGYTVLMAASGEEALDIASAYTGRIDVLFSDVVMPGLRGPGLATALLSSRPDMRVLLTSGYAEDVIGRRGIASAPGDFLAKPYTPSTLASAVARLLDENVTTAGVPREARQTAST